MAAITPVPTWKTSAWMRGRLSMARRLADLGATITGALSADGLDHYAVGMKDPEGNEFDIN